MKQHRKDNKQKEKMKQLEGYYGNERKVKILS